MNQDMKRAALGAALLAVALAGCQKKEETPAPKVTEAPAPQSPTPMSETPPAPAASPSESMPPPAEPAPNTPSAPPPAK
ncbi:MAG TPA: hypothetical protein VF501_01975 [Thiobacillus sp.]